MRAARRAGTIAANTVTRTPTTRPTTIVRGSTTKAVEGSPNPNAANAALSPTAMKSPSPTPIADATRPTATASITTMRVT
jgi:hypothetical protein